MTGKTGMAGETGETGETVNRSNGMKLETQTVRPPGQVSVRFNRKRRAYRLRFMSVHPDQAESIFLALKLARAEAETRYDTVALEFICLNYLATRSGKRRSVARGKQEEPTSE